MTQLIVIKIILGLALCGMKSIARHGDSIMRRLRSCSRRLASCTLTLLAVVWLNMALQPCLMAAEPLLPDQHHDAGCPHCPPATDRHCGNDDGGRCAFIDSIDFDGRQSGSPDLSHAWAPPPVLPVQTFLPTKSGEGVPAHPRPPTASGPPIFLRNCSFLK